MSTLEAQRPTRASAGAGAQQIGAYSYGRPWQRLSCAALVLASALLATRASLLADPASPWFTLAAAIAGVSGVFFAVRTFRVGVTVTDRWLEQRRVLTSWRLDWFAIDGIAADERVFLVRAAGRTHLHETPSYRRGNTPPFTVSIARGSCRPVPPVVLLNPPAPSEQLALPPTGPAYLAALLALGLWISLLVLGGGVADEARYEARAARDRFTSADVLDWEVRSDDDGIWWTDVDVAYLTPSEEEVTVHLTRRGEDRHEREVIDIRFDPEHPTDADFADGVNRHANERSARLTQALAAMALVAATVLLVITGFTFLVRHPGRSA